MNPWKTLNIKPTSDKKAIKKAYAVLLKKYKPDEFPNEFQDIQEAYQLALKLAKSETNSKIDVVVHRNIEAKKPLIKNEKPLDPVGLQFDSFQKSNDAFNKKELVSKHERILKKLHKTAFSRLDYKNDIKNWAFVKDYHEFYDIELFDDFALEFFDKVAEYNLFQMRQNQTLLIPKHILKYLDSIFNWNDRLNNYKYHKRYSQNVYDVTFYYLEDNKKQASKNVLLKKIHSPLLISRFLAQFIDLFITLVVVVLLQMGLEKTNDNYVLFPLLFWFVYNSHRVLFELFHKSHGSVGKIMLNLSAIDSFGNFPNKYNTLSRNLILQLNLLPIYMLALPSEILDELLIFDFLIFLLLLANLICLVVYKGFLHDKISNTQFTRIESHAQFR